jgi:DNA replication protein DnaC
MKETDESLLPSKFAQIKQWDEQGGKGIIIHGTTGTCKTRTVWMLLKYLTLEYNTDFFFVNSTDLATKISTQYARIEHSKEYSNFIHTCKIATILCIDDIGKEKFTERVSSELFSLIDFRSCHKLPIIYTSNYVGDELLAKFPSKEIGEPILRRIRENTISIHYKAIKDDYYKP